MCIDSSMWADCKQLPLHPATIFVASSPGIATLAAFCPWCNAKGPACGFTRTPEGRRGSVFPPARRPRTRIRYESFLELNSVQPLQEKEPSLASTARRNDGCRLQPPAPFPALQELGRNSRCARPGSRSVWGNGARGHPCLGFGHRGRILHDQTVLLCGWFWRKYAERVTQGGKKKEFRASF